MKPVLAVGFAAMALLGAACGGSDEAQVSATGVTSSDGNIEQVTADLITQFGSDEAAADALIIAMERGYSSGQILGAAGSGELRSDGTIEGQAPAGSPLGLVLYTVDEEGAAGPSGGIQSVGEVRLAAHRQIELTPVERLRDITKLPGPEGSQRTLVLMALLGNGFLAEDIVEALIFGIDDYDFLRDSCMRVVDEMICPGGERFPASDEPGESSGAAEPDDAGDGQTEAQDQNTDGEGSDVRTTGDTDTVRWTGSLTPDENIAQYEMIANDVILTRRPGTDDFELDAAYTYIVDAPCGAVEFTQSFTGVGTFTDDINIYISGESAVTYDGCSENPDTQRSWAVNVQISEQQLTGACCFTTFTLEGPPPGRLGPSS